MMPPLAGLRVLDFGQYIAGSGASEIFVYLGADVVKVERLRGEGARHAGIFGEAIVEGYNRGKRSIGIDLKAGPAREVLLRLIRGADVLIHNMRQDAMSSLGLGPEEVRSINPRIVYGVVSGFGSHGPAQDRLGYDISAQAESGMMALTGEAGGPPLRVGFSIVDAAAAHILAQGVLAALFRRERTGEGDTVHTSLLETAIHLQNQPLTQYFLTGEEPVRCGNGQASVAPAADLIQTADGYVVLSAYTNAHWARLCGLIGRPDLVEDPRFDTIAARVANRPALLAILNDRMSTMEAETCAAWLSDNGIVCGVVRSYSQVVASPDVQATGVIRRAHSPEEKTSEFVGSPITFGTWSMADVAAAPPVGRESGQILREIGFKDDEIADLVGRGVVSGGSDAGDTHTALDPE